MADRARTKTVHARDRIVSASVELFVGRGFAATSMRDIAAKAELTPGAIYNHFAGKEQILSGIVISDTTELRDKVQAAASDMSTDAAGLIQVIGVVAEHAVNHRDPMRIASREGSLLSAAASAELAELQREVIDILAAVLARCVAAGVGGGVIDNPRTHRATARFVMHGLIQSGNTLDYDQGWDIQQIIDYHVELIMNMLLGRRTEPTAN